MAAMYTDAMAPTTIRMLSYWVECGWRVRWCGVNTDGGIAVHLVRNGTTMVYELDIVAELAGRGKSGVIRNGEAEVEGQVLSIVPPGSDFFAPIRSAAILGVNIGSTCELVSNPEYTVVEGCTCGYDIELDLRGTERGGFPLSDCPILSIAMWCDCGFTSFISTLDHPSADSILVHTQPDMVRAFVDQVLSHMPLWLVGWNCYAFDNTCLNYHSDPDVACLFQQVKVGSASEVNYGYILNINGVYNMDPYLYVLRNPAHSSSFPSLSLADVAMKLNVKRKMDMPDLYVDMSPSEVYKYNMNDSAIVAEVWIASNLYTEVPSVALVMSSPIYDCIRYMSGAFAACSYSADAARMDKLIDWSRSARSLKYEGGFVMTPTRGVHQHVVICDYASMYPTIMMDGNISPEAITIEDCTVAEYGHVWWKEDMSSWSCQLDGIVATFDLTVPTIVRSNLTNKVSVRNKVKKTKPTYAGALKVGSNSLYGGMGYENSPMYSPACSSAVTAVGRWLLQVAARCFEQSGLTPVYGDTDSLVNKLTCAEHATKDKVMDVTRKALHALDGVLRTTPFSTSRMELESYHPSILLIDKKRYCKLDEDGSIVYKGLSVVRRDVIGLAKQACVVSCESVLRLGASHEASSVICRLVSDTVAKHYSVGLSFAEIAKVAKRDQRRCYIYTNSRGKETCVPVDMAGDIIPDYSAQVAFTALLKEVSKIAVIAGLGELHDIMVRHSTL